MKLYVIFQVTPERVLKPGTYFGNPQADQYEMVHRPIPIFTTMANTPGEACTDAAKKTKQMGDYIAIEGHLMGIDLNYSEKKELENGKKDDGFDGDEE